MRKKIYLSVIIPAYNEEKIIENSLSIILKFLDKRSFKWEIIVVDDGSSDKTKSLVKTFSKNNVRLVSLLSNKGKGAALREGVKYANGEFVIYTDADLSVPIKYINTFLRFLESGFDVVIGSRRVKGSNIKIHQPIVREVMGRFYTFLTKVITLNNISDFTCGFKGFRRSASKKIFKNSKIDRWAYDSEILFLAKKYNYTISQVPVEWLNREDSRVRLGLVVFESFKDLLSVRFNDILGKY